MGLELGPIDPLRPPEVFSLFGDVPAPWWIAGGWAIDLRLGTQTRDHEDIDVCLTRSDQLVVHDVLDGWDIQVAYTPGALQPWKREGWLDVANDIWCRRSAQEPWSLWVILNESEDAEWVFRRDPRIRLSFDRLIKHSSEGIPYLATEVLLLFKAKHMRPKDIADFEVALPVLDDTERSWLRAALQDVHPNHPWTERV